MSSSVNLISMMGSEQLPGHPKNAPPDMLDTTFADDVLTAIKSLRNCTEKSAWHRALKFVEPPLTETGTRAGAKGVYPK